MIPIKVKYGCHINIGYCSLPESDFKSLLQWPLCGSHKHRPKYLSLDSWSWHYINTGSEFQYQPILAYRQHAGQALFLQANLTQYVSYLF